MILCVRDTGNAVNRAKVLISAFIGQQALILFNILVNFLLALGQPNLAKLRLLLLLNLCRHFVKIDFQREAFFRGAFYHLLPD